MESMSQSRSLDPVSLFYKGIVRLIPVSPSGMKHTAATLFMPSVLC
jgi:hypothetical protein